MHAVHTDGCRVQGSQKSHPTQHSQGVLKAAATRPMGAEHKGPHETGRRAPYMRLQPRSPSPTCMWYTHMAAGFRARRSHTPHSKPKGSARPLQHVPWVQSTRGRTRREDVRLACGHIFALAAADLPPGAVRASKPLRVRLLDWLADAQSHCLPRDSLSGTDRCV